MKTEEIKLPFIGADFEVGDRVYCHDGITGATTFGTVWSINGDALTLGITMDSWSVKSVTVDMFHRHEEVFPDTLYWGKCLPLKHLHPGSVISLTTRTVKMTATVNSINEDEIVWTWNEDPFSIENHCRNSEHSLEYIMRFWELED